MSASIFSTGKFIGIGNNGLVLPYGKLYVNKCCTGENMATFDDSILTNENPYPVVLSASGKADVYLLDGTYDITLKDKDDVVVWTITNFIPSGGEGSTVTPGYISNYREEFTGITGDTITLESSAYSIPNVHKNGLLLEQSEYETDNNVITFTTPLIGSDTVIVDYMRDSSLLTGIVNTVDDITGLLALDSTYFNTAVLMKGRDDKSDNGGGAFIYDPSRSAENDGGTVFDGWVRQYVGEVYASWWGLLGDGTTDDAATLNTIFSLFKEVRLGKEHKVLSQVNIGKDVTLYGDTHINGDFVDFDVGGSYPTDGQKTVQVGEEDRVEIGTLATDIHKGNNYIPFVASHGLAEGDIFSLYENVDYSWSSARDYYRKGELLTVSEVVSATEVRVIGVLQDDYTGTVSEMTKVNMSTFSVIGSLKVSAGATGGGDTRVALRMTQINNSVMSNISAYANNTAYTAIELLWCYKCALSYIAKQEKLTGIGGDYGLAILSSQDIITAGYASSSRHGITHGTYGEKGSPIVRNCYHEGVWETTGEGDTFAADVHGCAENISFKGTAKGGMDVGGKKVKFDGLIYAERTSGVCIYGTEINCLDMDFSGCILYSAGNPYGTAGGRGVIDFGGNSTIDLDYMDSNATLNLSGITLNAPNAEAGIMIRRRNATQNAGFISSINMRNTNMTLSDTAIIPVLIDDDTSTLNWSNVYTEGLVHNLLYPNIIQNTDNITLSGVTGEDSIECLDSVSLSTVTVDFDIPFPTGYIPTVSVSLLGSAANGYFINPQVSYASESSFNVTIYTIDGSNFAATRTDTFVWDAR